MSPADLAEKVEQPSGPVAFVLSGGGKMASTELGMLAALAEAEIRPDMVLGSSAGAIIGAAFADRPGALGSVYDCWTEILTAPALKWTIPHATARLISASARARAQDCLRSIVERHIKARTFDELAVHFECNAIEMRSVREHWFDSGPLVPALLSAGAAPGMVAHTRIGGERYIDGGFVDPVPVDRAVRLGARTVYVLQASDFGETPHFPRTFWEAGFAEGSFRFVFEKLLRDLPDGVEVHLLPLGRRRTPHGLDMIRRIYGFDTAEAGREGEHYMEAAYQATAAYLRLEGQIGRSARKRVGGHRPAT
ncbi:patatin-like phospholipase family protein [Actinomadura rayongensis]|uniref:Patatin-like phospholipase family protein n=1 Tax=Actinomadura rayongensis TaxID=1429076 RepID=A0A6I4WBV6_9ACTN|nr:patatin-like phospholipase family protein [Actinomadura rayongensis]MXQ65755.1 patatin-like phospholipase family protein [Actinomadura rayongensis]